jgi:hypothetical protein
LETRRFSLRQRLLLRLISWASYLAISLIGPTLRYSISWEEPPSPPDATYEKPVIYSFWHRAVFASAWLWRKTGIAVMVSRSFDGEYIARTIEQPRRRDRSARLARPVGTGQPGCVYH